MNAYSADFDRCDCNIIHEEVVAEVRTKMPDEEALLNLADLFKVFGDSTRVKIVCALNIAGKGNLSIIPWMTNMSEIFLNRVCSMFVSIKPFILPE